MLIPRLPRRQHPPKFLILFRLGLSDGVRGSFGPRPAPIGCRLCE